MYFRLTNEEKKKNAQLCSHFSSRPEELWVADETGRRAKFQSELFENFDHTISVLIHSAGA